jgi:hypothetical protein
VDPEAGVEYQRDEIRAAWHCGWMEKSEWTGKSPCVPSMFGDEPYKEDVCPGYLMAQPLVGEIVVAHRAFEKGNWSSMYPNASNALCEGVEWFSACIDAYQNYQIRESSKKTK